MVAREALFLLVFGSRPTIKAALGRLLNSPVTDRLPAAPQAPSA
jgi:hypothetical protein